MAGIYDMASAIRQPDAGGLSRGIQVGQQMADRRRQNQARNALARLQQGDTSAMAELQQADPDAAMKWGEMQRAEEMRTGLKGFLKPATGATNVPGINSLAALANGHPAQPASYDFEGAMNYAAGRGELDQAASLGQLRDKIGPAPVEVHGTTREDADGNVYALGKNGQWIPAPFKAKPEAPKSVGGFLVDPSTNQLGAPIPMTPAQIAADRRASEAADRANRQLEVSVAGLQQNQAKSQQEMQDKTEKKQQERDGKFKSVNDLDATLAAYRQSLSGASRADLANPLSDKAVELQNLATQLQMAYKNAAELGAITGPDWAIINRIVATPSGAKAALLGPEKLIKQLDQVEALSKRQRSELNRVYGDQAKPAAQNKPRQPAARKDTSTAVNWLKSQKITDQGRFDAAVASLKKQGWGAEEINQALDKAGL